MVDRNAQMLSSGVIVTAGTLAAYGAGRLVGLPAAVCLALPLTCSIFALFAFGCSVVFGRHLPESLFSFTASGLAAAAVLLAIFSNGGSAWWLVAAVVILAKTLVVGLLAGIQRIVFPQMLLIVGGAEMLLIALILG